MEQEEERKEKGDAGEEKEGRGREERYTCMYRKGNWKEERTEREQEVGCLVGENEGKREEKREGKEK